MEIIHAIGGFCPMRCVEYDYEEVSISMDKYSIHGRNILSMDLKYPWVPCNIYGISVPPPYSFFSHVVVTRSPIEAILMGLFDDCIGVRSY